MSEQKDLFDYADGERRKEEGMGLAASSKQELLDFARCLAVEIALSRPDRTCTADDVQLALHARGISIFSLGNAAGSLFRGKHWEFTQRWIKSERTHSHRNDIRIWRYVGPEQNKS